MPSDVMEIMSPLPLAGRHIALGVTGSISAYKAADLASKLRQSGATVEVVMTPAATRFIAPLTFQSLTGRAVVIDMFAAEEAEAHVEVARRADAPRRDSHPTARPARRR